MKKFIKAIELYPIYTLRDDQEFSRMPSIEISDELYAQWILARKEFVRVQNEIDKLIFNQNINL